MKYVLLVCLLTSASSCTAKQSEARALSHDEVARVTSPDSVVDAVATVAAVDATTSYVHRVYVVPRGASVPYKTDHEEFRADYVSGLTLAWSRARTLDIGYDTARIFHFRNSWQSREVHDHRYEVEVRLAPRNPSSLPVREFPPSWRG